MIRTLRSVARFRRFEPNRAKRRLSRAASVADLWELARRRLPGSTTRQPLALVAGSRAVHTPTMLSAGRKGK